MTPITARITADVSATDIAVKEQPQPAGFSILIQRFGQEARFNGEQISSLTTVVRRVHEQSAADFYTRERSLRYFADVLCNYGIDGKPLSKALWTPEQLRRIARWMVAEYYDRYPVYQSISRPVRTLDLATTLPVTLIETPSTPPPPLSYAITESEHENRVAEERQHQEELATQRVEAELREKARDHLEQLPEDFRTAIETYILTSYHSPSDTPNV